MKTNLMAATAALLPAATAWAQGQHAQELARLQSLAKKIQPHIPRGWRLQAAAQGDLNAHSVPGVALAQRNDRAGQLLVLLKDGRRYKVAAKDQHLVCGKKIKGLSEHFEYSLNISGNRLNFLLHKPEGTQEETYPFQTDKSGQYRLTSAEFASAHMAAETERFDLLAKKCSYAAEAGPQEIENLAREGTLPASPKPRRLT